MVANGRGGREPWFCTKIPHHTRPRVGRHDELVRTHLDVACNRDRLAFVQDAEAVFLVDRDVLDRIGPDTFTQTDSSPANSTLAV
jgi:hypothetical protein